MKKSRRNAFSVTSSLQYRFLAMSLIYSFVIVCFFAGAVFGPDFAKMSDESIPLEIRSAAASRVLAKHTWVWPVLFLLIALLGIHSFREFQKVAGPLYRFRWAFGELAKGNRQRLWSMVTLFLAPSFRFPKRRSRQWILKSTLGMEPVSDEEITFLKLQVQTIGSLDVS